MRKLLFLLIAGTTFIANAQNESNSGARSFGVAGNSILFSDVWAVNNNPAASASLKQWNAGVSYENRFLQSELSSKTIVFNLPVSIGNFGLSVNQFGYQLYNENKVGISYGQKLGKNLSMGIQLNYLNTSIGEGYGSTSAVSANIGLLAKINEELSLAAVVVNPNRAKLADYTDERYATLLKLGLSYSISEKLVVLSEVNKDIDYDTNVKGGIEYKPSEKLYLRAGYATQPSLTSFGFGLNLEHFKLDFASGFDSHFGFSPQISISYSPEKSKE